MTHDYDELVKRLRGDYGPMYGGSSLAKQAADAIERLESALRRADGEAVAPPAAQGVSEEMVEQALLVLIGYDFTQLPVSDKRRAAVREALQAALTKGG